ncbi:MAG TPA: SIS domain-containing protein [Elusimicrobiota bacterium]|nr:SIS domain-containing protein [Elusimicrobiota bacterium]
MSAAKMKIRGTLPGRFHSSGPGKLGPGDFARWYRRELLRAWDAVDWAGFEAVAKAVAEAGDKGRQVFVMGNGGSAATASHMAVDFSKTAANPKKPLVRCLSLADNPSFITAVGNDLSFDETFSRQLENLLNPKDVVLFISGSGNSKNLLSAARLARRRKAWTAAFLGFDGGRLKGLVDASVVVASDQYGVIEDVHLSLGHMVTFYLKQRA